MGVIYTNDTSDDNFISNIKFGRIVDKINVIKRINTTKTNCGRISHIIKKTLFYLSKEYSDRYPNKRLEGNSNYGENGEWVC